MEVSYLMIVYLSDKPDKLKKCICNHKIRQEELLEKINYNSKNSLMKSNIFKCDNCHIKINITIL